MHQNEIMNENMTYLNYGKSNYSAHEAHLTTKTRMAFTRKMECFLSQTVNPNTLNCYTV